MSAETVPPAPTADRGTSVAAGRITRGCDHAVDGAVVLLASWTVVYHFCLITRLGTTVAVLLEILVLAVGVTGWRRLGRRPDPWTIRSDGSTADPRPLPTYDRPLFLGAVAATVAAAALFAFDANWPLTAALWLIAAALGGWWAVGRLLAGATPEQGSAEGRRPTSSPEVAVAVVVAVAMAVMSSILLRPNPDDWFYVNLSQWVAEHGSFPIRDTVFSDLDFPMATWPPTASYDALAGTVAGLFGVHAGTIVYVVVPPVAAALSVLALWRLLRTWRIRGVAVALVVAIAYLLFNDGPSYATAGDLFVTRLWQGKVVLLCVMVPVLLTYALNFGERPSRRRLGWLLMGGAAAVGLSTTAMFLVPIIAVASMTPLAVRGRIRDALAGFAALAAYPVASGIVTVAVDGHSADDFGSRELFRFDPDWFGHAIYLDGVMTFVVVACVLGGALLLPRADARVMTAGLVLITGITFVPGVTDLSYDLVGLGPTLWRVSWVCTTAALIGAAGVTLSNAIDGPPLLRRLLVPGVFVVVFVVFGSPIWTAGAGVELKRPWDWQRSKETMTVAEAVIDASEPGDVVLAPEGLSVTLDVLTTDVKVIAPRAYVMDYLRDEPGFGFADRSVLTEFANLEPDAPFDAARVRSALDRLHVDTVCLPADSERRVMFLEGSGYIPGVATASYGCLDRLAS